MKQHLVPKFLAVLASLLLPSCSATDVLNGLSHDRNLRISRDIAYEAGTRQRLDVYAPPNSAKAPVIIFFYGGAWTSGNKADYRFVATALASKGFVVVIPDYRLYPEVRFPEFLRDAADATLWVTQHIGEFGGDPSNMVMMGHSAGAYIAAMLLIDPQWLSHVGLEPAKAIRAGVGIAGPYDFLPLKDPELKDIFGPPENLAQTQPINFVDGKAPPLLLVAGENDKRVKPANTTRLAARITEKGGRAETILYPRIGHVEIIGAFSPTLGFLAPVLKDVTKFIEAETAQ